MEQLLTSPLTPSHPSSESFSSSSTNISPSSFCMSEHNIELTKGKKSESFQVDQSRSFGLNWKKQPQSKSSGCLTHEKKAAEVAKAEWKKQERNNIHSNDLLQYSRYWQGYSPSLLKPPLVVEESHSHILNKAVNSLIPARGFKKQLKAHLTAMHKDSKSFAVEAIDQIAMQIIYFEINQLFTEFRRKSSISHEEMTKNINTIAEKILLNFTRSALLFPILDRVRYLKERIQLIPTTKKDGVLSQLSELEKTDKVSELVLIWEESQKKKQSHILSKIIDQTEITSEEVINKLKNYAYEKDRSFISDTITKQLPLFEKAKDLSTKKIPWGGEHSEFDPYKSIYWPDVFRTFDLSPGPSRLVSLCENLLINRMPIKFTEPQPLEKGKKLTVKETIQQLMRQFFTVLIERGLYKEIFETMKEKEIEPFISTFTLFFSWMCSYIHPVSMSNIIFILLKPEQVIKILENNSGTFLYLFSNVSKFFTFLRPFEEIEALINKPAILAKELNAIEELKKVLNETGNSFFEDRPVLEQFLNSPDNCPAFFKGAEPLFNAARKFHQHFEKFPLLANKLGESFFDIILMISARGTLEGSRCFREMYEDLILKKKYKILPCEKIHIDLNFSGIPYTCTHLSICTNSSARLKSLGKNSQELSPESESFSFEFTSFIEPIFVAKGTIRWQGSMQIPNLPKCENIDFENHHAKWELIKQLVETKKKDASKALTRHSMVLTLTPHTLSKINETS